MSTAVCRSLADLNADGKMDRKEFSIAVHLIKKKLQGYELPKTLPPSLVADPVPGPGVTVAPMAGFGMPAMTIQHGQMSMGEYWLGSGKQTLSWSKSLFVLFLKV